MSALLSVEFDGSLIIKENDGSFARKKKSRNSNLKMSISGPIVACWYFPISLSCYLYVSIQWLSCCIRSQAFYGHGPILLRAATPGDMRINSKNTGIQ